MRREEPEGRRMIPSLEVGRTYRGVFGTKLQWFRITAITAKPDGSDVTIYYRTHQYRLLVWCFVGYPTDDSVEMFLDRIAQVGKFSELNRIVSLKKIHIGNGRR